MTEEPSREFLKRHLELADRYLRSARLLFEDRDLRSAVDRSYYAMFLGAHALLTKEKIKEPKTHKGLITVFGKEIVEMGKVERQLGSDHSDAFDARQAGTYRIHADLGRKGVTEIIEKAENFVKRVKEILL